MIGRRIFFAYESGQRPAVDIRLDASPMSGKIYVGRSSDGGRIGYMTQALLNGTHHFFCLTSMFCKKEWMLTRDGDA